MWYRHIITAEKHTSVIVALWLPKNAANKISVEKLGFESNAKLESNDDLHITLIYLGKADALADKKDLIESVIENFAQNNAPIKGKIQGVGCFSGDGETKPFYASYDSPELPILRQSLFDAIESAGVVMEQNHGFTPHITLAYLDANDDLPNISVPEIDVEFTQITLAWAEKQTHYKFSKKSEK